MQNDKENVEIVVAETHQTQVPKLEKSTLPTVVVDIVNIDYDKIAKAKTTGISEVCSSIDFGDENSPFYKQSFLAIFIGATPETYIDKKTGEEHSSIKTMFIVLYNGNMPIRSPEELEELKKAGKNPTARMHKTGAWKIRGYFVDVDPRNELRIVKFKARVGHTAKITHIGNINKGGRKQVDVSIESLIDE